ncbi:unnamed protein product [Amoebophrya sp. A25]|nr:unnamed protein product [Amoebophrya sp. A25]|eukprot:GSA25T00024346001.1
MSLAIPKNDFFSPHSHSYASSQNILFLIPSVELESESHSNENFFPLTTLLIPLFSTKMTCNTF